MASSKPQASTSAASPEELSEVQVLDSNEPLVTASSSVPSCSVPVMDSSEPPVPTTPRVQVLDSVEPLVLGAPPPPVQVLDSVEPLVLGAPPPRVQVLDSNEPLVLGAPPAAASPREMDSGDESLDESMASARAGSSPGQISGASTWSGSPPRGLPEDTAGPSRPRRPRGPTGSSNRRIHPYSSELSSMWNWRRVFSELGSDEQCVAFAEERGLIAQEKICQQHRRPMTLTKTAGQLGKFRCRKTPCRTSSISRAVGTWFEGVRLSIVLVFQLMYAFSEGVSYHDARKQTALPGEPVVSEATVADWYSYCRETVIVYELEHQEDQTKLGGPGKIVQIDESKFGRRKYNRGRQIEGHWVIGMIEDGNDDLRLEVCPDNERTSQVLVPLIKNMFKRAQPYTQTSGEHICVLDITINKL